MSKLKTNTIRHVDGSNDNITLDSSQNVTVEGNATVDGTSTLTGNVTCSGQLKADALRHTGASSDAVTLASDGTCTAKVTNNLSNRNLIINGSQIIDQRNGGNSITIDSNGEYPVDRFELFEDTDGTLTATQLDITDLENFTKCLRLIVGTADSSLAASQYYSINYRVEAFDSSHLRWGSSDAQTVTLSFWAKSSVAGDHSCAFRSSNGNETYQFKYTLPANTWTKVTKTITGPTSGNFPSNSSAKSFDIVWGMAGSTLASSTLNSWHTGVSWGLAASGAVNLMATASAIFDLTGVQLEAGDVATDFEHRSYGTELAKCQRYCYADRGTDDYHAVAQGHYNGTTAGICMIYTPVAMRAAPDLYYPAGTWICSGDAGTVNQTNIYPADNIGGVNAFQIRTTVSGAESGEGFLLRTSSAAHTWYLDAEL